MKKKNNKIVLIILILIIIVETIAIYVLATRKEETSNTTTKITEEEVSTQTIENTLTASGEVTTSNVEKLYPNTNKYFTTMCVEENDEVKYGENILKYSDGTYLTAEYDCLISSYSVPAANSKCTSSNYVEVKNLDTLTMDLSIDETEISKVTKGQNATITITALNNKEYTGTVSKISELGTYASNGSSFSATVVFENDDQIKLGMSASCTIVLEKSENVLSVPIEAVKTKNNEKYVVLINDDGTTTDTIVTTGVSNDEYVQILTGLTQGQKIQIVQALTTSTSTSNNSSSSSMFGNGMQKGSESTGMQEGFDKSTIDRGSMGGSAGGQMTPPGQN